MDWDKIESSSIDGILHWAKEQSWAESMSNCMQDSQWHSEGDVWTHTLMVVGELQKLEAWDDLDAESRMVLLFTALLHDVAKPQTTEVDPETGRVSSPKHAVVGEGVARNVLRKVGCPLRTREMIAQLVRYHGRPVFLLEKRDPVHEVVKLSWLVNNRLLYLFSVADNRGRDTDSRSRPEENLHFWKLLAIESGCYESPYPFATSHARYTFFHQSTPNLHYVPHEDFRCKVTMMSGLPGSGKDTWLAKNRSDLPIVSLDELREELDVEPTENQGQVAQLAQQRCREHLRAGRSFAFNATNIQKQTRERWLRLFADYNARIEIVYLEPPIERILLQNSSRSRQVPERVIQKLAERCEPPTWHECHDLIIGQ